MIGLDPRRADVILAGALILDRIAAAGRRRRDPGQRPRHPLGPFPRAYAWLEPPGDAACWRTEPGGIFLACAAPGWPRSSGWHLPPCPACRAKVPTIDAPFTDDFERAELGADWNATSDAVPDRGRQADRLERAQPSRLAAAASCPTTWSSTSTRSRRARRATSSSSCSATANRSIPTRALHVVGLRADLRRLEQFAVGHLPAGGARRRPQGRRAATSASSRAAATTSRSPGKAARSTGPSTAARS